MRYNSLLTGPPSLDTLFQICFSKTNCKTPKNGLAVTVFISLEFARNTIWNGCWFALRSLFFFDLFSTKLKIVAILYYSEKLVSYTI